VLVQSSRLKGGVTPRASKNTLIGYYLSLILWIQGFEVFGVVR